MQVLPTDSHELIVLMAFGLAIAALFAIHFTVVLTDIRRELRSLRRAVGRVAFVRHSAADNPAGRHLGPATPSTQENPK